MVDKVTIKENINKILEDIKNYSPQPEMVRLLPVTKTVGVKEIEAILEVGPFLLGENRVQVLRDKIETFSNPKITWDFIGNLQKNKVKYIAEDINLIHSLNKLSLGKEINKQGGKIGKKINCLLEVNTSKDPNKEGYLVDDLYLEIEELLKLKFVNIIGLMTMAPFVEDEATIRDAFITLRDLKDELNSSHFNGSLKELSMGMSGDYKIALEEGSTIIRVGSKIFERS